MTLVTVFVGGRYSVRMGDDAGATQDGGQGSTTSTAPEGTCPRVHVRRGVVAGR